MSVEYTLPDPAFFCRWFSKMSAVELVLTHIKNLDIDFTAFKAHLTRNGNQFVGTYNDFEGNGSYFIMSSRGDAVFVGTTVAQMINADCGPGWEKRIKRTPPNGLFDRLTFDRTELYNWTFAFQYNAAIAKWIDMSELPDGKNIKLAPDQSMILAKEDALVKWFLSQYEISNNQYGDIILNIMQGKPLEDIPLGAYGSVEHINTLIDSIYKTGYPQPFG